MADFDAEMLADQAVLLGLVPRDQMQVARAEARDGSLDALRGALLRRGLLTSWQVDRLVKGESSGFFYGGYEVLFHLAEGTFARVYRGRKVGGGEPVAVKVLRQRFSQDSAAIEVFNHEAEAGMQLVHPNIVRILDYGAQDGRHFMIMEFVEGSNLRDFLRLRHRLEPKEAMPLMIGLASGLRHSLRKGVTHRDIKPTNILVSAGGQAKLVDFGLATIEGDERKLAQAHGQRTVDYSALERTCGSRKGDPRSDIYFLGCVFYQMLTGRLPLPEVEADDFLAKMLKRSFGAIKPISEMDYAPDPELCRIIEKMMKMELARRYQSMDEVVADLEAYYQTMTGQAAPKAEVAEEESLDIGDLFMKRRREEALAEAGDRAGAAGGGDADEEDFEIGAAGDEPGGRPPGFGASADRRRKVLCVEAQEPIQDAFRKALSKLGYRVLLVGDAERAADRYRESPTDAVIFDLDGLGGEALDTFLGLYDEALDDGRELGAVVLIAPRQGPLADRIPRDDRLIVLTKPIKMKQIQESLAQLAPINAG